MRTALLLLALSTVVAAPAYAQRLAFRAGGDLVVGSYRPAGASTSELALGGAGLFAVRTPGPMAAYGALRPEVTVLAEGSTGSYHDRDALYYDEDGLPVYGGGTGLVRGALSAEAGLRLALGRGAALLGVGLRGGAGDGLYGAVTGQLANPAHGRLEFGTGHVMIGLGFSGRL